MASSVIKPRIRVDRSTNLSLTTSWQKVVFDGTSLLNTNTFGEDPTEELQMIVWDDVDELFRFYDKIDQDYLVYFNATTTTDLVSVRATLRYRFVIPDGGGIGIDTYFPFEENGGFVDAGEVTVLTVAVNHNFTPLLLGLNETIRDNGCYLEVKLSNALATLGTCTIDNCDLLIRSLK